MSNSHLTMSVGKIGKKDRESRLSQKAITYWITGLSGSGKSTLAYALENELFSQGKLSYVLDGDNIRHGLNKNSGFSTEDRSENIRRIAEVSRLMNDAGLIVICAFISPYQADRQMAKEIIGDQNFFEIYLNTSLATCEHRDPKGLYVKARQGKLNHFTGISAPYEEPSDPQLIFDTALVTVPDMLKIIFALTKDKSN